MKKILVLVVIMVFAISIGFGIYHVLDRERIKTERELFMNKVSKQTGIPWIGNVDCTDPDIRGTVLKRAGFHENSTCIEFLIGEYDEFKMDIYEMIVYHHGNRTEVLYGLTDL